MQAITRATCLARLNPALLVTINMDCGTICREQDVKGKPGGVGCTLMNLQGQRMIQAKSSSSGDIQALPHSRGSPAITAPHCDGAALDSGGVQGPCGNQRLDSACLEDHRHIDHAPQQVGQGRL